MNNSALDTIVGLLEHFSPSGSEQHAAEWLAAHMRDLGFDRAYIDEVGNAIGIYGDGDKQIVLLGHIDTVPGEIPLRFVGDNLFGRGAVDAKGPLATFVQAVAKLGRRSGWQFRVIGAIDEERDSIGARSISKQYQPNYAIIGEPSNWNRVTIGYKGSAYADITVNKPQTHGASSSENACEAAFRIWSDILAYASSFNSDQGRLFDQLLVSLTEISSGTNHFENWANLRIGARLPLELPPTRWYQILDSLTIEAKVNQRGYPLAAYQSDKNNPLIRAFLQAIRNKGGKPGFVLKTGTSDMNIVAPIWNCPIIAYGPGDSNLDHTPNEHLSINEYYLAIDVLLNALEQLTTDPNG